ncbi:hypothetical protein ACGLHS_01145 [Variovorax sp. VaC1]|uniref:hypothetical protein n=1 Tax=Variovorax sp. VaC1 TaxID=3373132 RepID=UPI0037484CF0
MFFATCAAGPSLSARIQALSRRVAACVLLSALAACGGGGGGGGGTSFPVLPITQPPAPNQPDTPAPPAPITYQATLTPTAGEVTVGKTLQLVVSMVDSQGHGVPNPPTVFTSSDPTLAAVASQDGAASTGVVTGVAKGPVQITAKATAPDGTVLTQQATVTVVAVPLTYKFVLANPTVNLQYGQPMTVSATVLASDGSDVTAAATGWSWNSSDSNVVGITPSGATASLLANTARTQAESATITVQASAPNGNIVSGQISATALPHYTYRIELSATTAKVAADRPATINAKVIRSDSVDVTSESSNWKWTWTSPPISEGDLTLQTLPAASATFKSTRPDWWDENRFGTATPRSTPDAGLGVTVQVQAEHGNDAVSPATLETTMYARFSFVYEGPFTIPPDNAWHGGKLYFEHSSAEGRPVIPCISSFDLPRIRYSQQTLLVESRSNGAPSTADPNVLTACASNDGQLDVTWQLNIGVIR